MIYGKPFKNKKDNFINITNELISSITLLPIFAMSLQQGEYSLSMESEDRVDDINAAEWFCTVLVMVMIIFNFVVGIVDQIVLYYKQIKAYLQKKRKGKKGLNALNDSE